MPDVIGYARVSTAEQDLEVQRRRLRDEAGAIRVFDDVASGKSFDRPGLAALLDYARVNPVDHIVMGARADTAMRRLLGGVSSEVAARAPCTVTVVRPRE